MDNRRENKLVIVGDAHVGKTCILITKQTGKFPENYIPTVFDNCVTEITVDDKLYSLALWDIAVQNI